MTAEQNAYYYSPQKLELFNQYVSDIFNSSKTDTKLLLGNIQRTNFQIQFEAQTLYSYKNETEKAFDSQELQKKLNELIQHVLKVPSNGRMIKQLLKTADQGITNQVQSQVVDSVFRPELLNPLDYTQFIELQGTSHQTINYIHTIKLTGLKSPPVVSGEGVVVSEKPIELKTHYEISLVKKWGLFGTKHALKMECKNVSISSAENYNEWLKKRDEIKAQKAQSEDPALHLNYNWEEFVKKELSLVEKKGIHHSELSGPAAVPISEKPKSKGRVYSFFTKVLDRFAVKSSAISRRFFWPREKTTDMSGCSKFWNFH